eukprot:GHVQ01034165.1.p1 GENE.GHVQ01034165.1~~GHVQ01034165.1.p1  ORF type:complete len:104 (-),score=14.60 GHVQ01034165.1:90-401(-)
MMKSTHHSVLIPLGVRRQITTEDLHTYNKLIQISTIYISDIYIYIIQYYLSTKQTDWRVKPYRLIEQTLPALLSLSQVTFIDRPSLNSALIQWNRAFCLGRRG